MFYMNRSWYCIYVYISPSTYLGIAVSVVLAFFFHHHCLFFNLLWYNEFLIELDTFFFSSLPARGVGSDKLVLLSPHFWTWEALFCTYLVPIFFVASLTKRFFFPLYFWHHHYLFNPLRPLEPSGCDHLTSSNSPAPSYPVPSAWVRTAGRRPNAWLSCCTADKPAKEKSALVSSRQREP